jgi:hypothetical protein
MKETRIIQIASIGLILGGVFGIIGSFVPWASIRGLAWGIDGICLVVSTCLLTTYYFKKGYDMVAVGFLVFAIGQGLILSGSGIDPSTSVSSFGAGAGLWSVSLLIISSQRVFPIVVRCLGIIAGVLFLWVAIVIFMSGSLNALSEPWPFYAYPFFALTIFGWAWTLLRLN